MKISDSALRIREKIDKAIVDHQITHDEYELIIAIAYEDGVLDAHEKALLKQLQEMIEHKEIKIVHSKPTETE
jgi:hypothetical protein